MVKQKGIFITDLSTFLAIIAVIVGCIFLYLNFAQANGRIQVLTDISKIYVYSLQAQEADEYYKLALKYSFEKTASEFNLNKQNAQQLITNNETQIQMKERIKQIYLEYVKKLSDKRSINTGEIRGLKMEKIDDNIKISLVADYIKIGYADQFVFIDQNQTQAFSLS